MNILKKKKSRNALENLKPVKKVKVYQSIMEQITSLIDDGSLNSGDKLPSERELAETFDVSRHTVREALRSLETKKEVKSLPGSGTFIARYSEEDVAQFITQKALKETGNIVDIFELRKMIEPQVAYLATINASSKEKKQLADILEGQRASSEAGKDKKKQLQYVDAEFHRLIAKMARNKIVFGVLEQIDGLLKWCRDDQYQGIKRIKQSMDDHENILKAILEGDPDRAKESMSEHIEAIRQIVLKKFLLNQ